MTGCPGDQWSMGMYTTCTAPLRPPLQPLQPGLRLAAPAAPWPPAGRPCRRGCAAVRTQPPAGCQTAPASGAARKSAAPSWTCAATWTCCAHKGRGRRVRAAKGTHKTAQQHRPPRVLAVSTHLSPPAVCFPAATPRGCVSNKAGTGEAVGVARIAGPPANGNSPPSPSDGTSPKAGASCAFINCRGGLSSAAWSAAAQQDVEVSCAQTTRANSATRAATTHRRRRRCSPVR